MYPMVCDEFVVSPNIFSHPAQTLSPLPASTTDALSNSAQIPDTAGWEALSHVVKIF